MTLEGGTQFSEGGTTLFRATLGMPRVYYDQCVIIRVFEIICRRLWRLQIISKTAPSTAEGTVLQSARGLGPRSPPPCIRP